MAKPQRPGGLDRTLQSWQFFGGHLRRLSERRSDYEQVPHPEWNEHPGSRIPLVYANPARLRVVRGWRNDPSLELESDAGDRHYRFPRRIQQRLPRALAGRRAPYLWPDLSSGWPARQ